MAKVLTFRYPECGFEVTVRMVPGQSKTALARRMGPVVSRRHRRTCEPCRQRRRERFMVGRFDAPRRPTPLFSDKP